MKKRLFARAGALLCALALAVNMVSVAHAADAQITISSAATTRGGTCSVTVTGENLSNLTSLELIIAYDASALTVTGTSTASMDIATADAKTPGFVRYSGISMDGISGTKDLLTISFLVAADADIKAHTIQAFVVGATAMQNGSDQRVTLSVQTGVISVEAQKKIYFYSSVSDSAIESGDEVTLTIYSYTLQGLAAGQFVFSYDSSLFEYQTFTLLDAMKNAEHTYSVNAVAGRVMVSYILDGEVSSGNLMSITLRAKNDATGSSQIKFEPNGLVDTETKALSGTTVTSTVSISEKIQVWLDTPTDSNAHERFSVGFWAEGMSRLAAGDFSVSYNPELLECLSVSTSLSSGDGVIPASGYVVINDAWQDGTINFSVLCPQGISKDTQFIVMEFQPKEHASTTFELIPKVETTPVDRLGNPIQLDSPTAIGMVEAVLNADADGNHCCDTCGLTISQCADENPADHKCDICGATVSECADENNDHKCDVCGETTSTHEPGDANHDGKVDSSDAVMILRNLAGYEVPGFYEDTADFNGDGKADSSDAVAILRKLAGY